MPLFAIALSLILQLQAADAPKDKDCGPCKCKIEVTEPKAFDGTNCPKGYLATGVASVRPPAIHCAQVTCKCVCEEEDGKNE